VTSTLFLILAALGIAAALGTVLARNLVHAALYLVAFFFLVACQFVLLEAEFLAAAQVLVYIGAVAILLVFGIMLTRNVRGDETTAAPWTWSIPAALVALGFLSVLVVGIEREAGLNSRPPWRAIQARPAVGPDPLSRTTPQARAVDDMGRTLGNELMGRFAVPFEIAGLLLTAALIGSIALARQEEDLGEPTPTQLNHRTGVRRRYRAVVAVPPPVEPVVEVSQP